MPTHRARHHVLTGCWSDEHAATALFERLGVSPAPGGTRRRHAAPPSAPPAPLGAITSALAAFSVAPAPAVRVRRSGPAAQPVFAAISVTVLGATAAVTAVTGSIADGAPTAAPVQLTSGAVDVDGPVSRPAPEFPRLQVAAMVRDTVSTARALVDEQAGAAAAAEKAAAEKAAAEKAAAEKVAADKKRAAAAAKPAPKAAAAPAAVSSIGAKALAAAMTKLGRPYVWGAAGPSAFDCSGLVLWAFKQSGVSLPHSSSMQSTMGTAVSRDQLQPGDLVFFYSPVSHVGIYAGGGKVLNASQSGEPVKMSELSRMPFHNARRL